jgi:hypothetical protein
MGTNTYIHTRCTLRSNSCSSNVMSGLYLACFGGKRTLVRAKKWNYARNLTWLARLLAAFRARYALQSREAVLIIIYKSLLRYGHMVVVLICSSKFRVQITNSKHTMCSDGMTNVARCIKCIIRNVSEWDEYEIMDLHWIEMNFLQLK